MSMYMYCICIDEPFVSNWIYYPHIEDEIFTVFTIKIDLLHLFYYYMRNTLIALTQNNVRCLSFRLHMLLMPCLRVLITVSKKKP